MTTPAQWAELVTTALLGTDRRPLDVADPPAEVLHQAARHRVLDRLAAAAAPSTPDPAADQAAPDPSRVVAPAQDRPEAPETADLLLQQLLRTPDPALVSCWLQVCAAHGYVVASLHWTVLARLAARSTVYDRTALAASIGPRGRWFLHQNPEWRRLAADADAAVVSIQPAAVPTPPAAGAATPGSRAAANATGSRDRLRAEDVLADPERLLTHPQPWTPELVSAAYAVLGGDGGVPPARTFATRLGVALPLELYPSIARAGEYYVLAPDASPARRRTVRDRFVALELAAYARAAIQHAFTNGTTGFTRAEIPHV
ncbi:hypothetical protein GCM10022204_09760 [Microlunatus aurantiacus]|uniref:Uncharacterized protein n=1 Tax=Microlunatus aurantiacus TaxID=446786 RepID=A0ABP7CT19_9ACTN